MYIYMLYRQGTHRTASLHSLSPTGCTRRPSRARAWALGLYTILHCQYCMVYGIRTGGRILRNSRAIVLHYCGRCKRGKAVHG